jgi:hypothetical protein
MLKIPLYAILAASSVAACGGPGKSTDDGPNFGDDDDDDVLDTHDTASGGALPVVDLVPAAIGVEIESGISAAGQLTYASYPGSTTVEPPLLIISITDVEYFDLSSESPERRNHVCEFYAEFPHIVQYDPGLGYAFDWEAAGGITGATFPLWFFAEGSAAIYSNGIAYEEDGETPYLDENGEYVDAPACTSLFEQGYPEAIDGMHVGIGFGPLTPYLTEDIYEDFKDPDLAEIEASITGMFVAINHPNAAEPGGYDFLPMDWGGAYFFEAFVSATELVDGDGNTFVADVAAVTVTPDNLLVYSTPQEDALVRGYPFWYEDYPNLDLSLLKEGVPLIP